jgi:hypothetical protein
MPFYSTPLLAYNTSLQSAAMLLAAVGTYRHVGPWVVPDLRADRLKSFWQYRPHCTSSPLSAATSIPCSHHGTGIYKHPIYIQCVAIQYIHHSSKHQTTLYAAYPKSQ